MTDIHSSATVADIAVLINSKVGRNCMIGTCTSFNYSELDDYSYVSSQSHIYSTKKGKYCCLSWNVSVNPAKYGYYRITQHSYKNYE